jgi:hypothetical protein
MQKLNVGDLTLTSLDLGYSESINVPTQDL